MIIENNILQVELDDKLPIVRKTVHKPTGITVNGFSDGQPFLVEINGRLVHPHQYESETRESGKYTLRIPGQGIELSLSFSLEGSEIVWRLDGVKESNGGRLETLYFPWHDMAVVGSEWSFRRLRFEQRGWTEKWGPGLWDSTKDTGIIADAEPDGERKAVTFACAWNDDLCVTARNSFMVKPIELHLRAGKEKRMPEGAAFQSGTYHYRAGEKVLDKFEFRLAFLTDINGDGKPDDQDAAVWARRFFLAPNPIYGKSFWYKVFCGEEGKADTTFDQTLDIIKLVNLISDGMPQIAYLVGWQYEGHDTGYPAIDKVNDLLGGQKKLHELFENAKKYDTVVSYHINVDDAYPDSTEWDPEIITKNPDGTPLKWETFYGRQSYHIGHSLDVAKGSFFRRFENFMAVAPLEKTIHIDAFRISNESWEADRHIGLVEELELGVKPIVEYLHSKGIDPSTEAIDRFPADLTGVLSGIWHFGDPMLHHGKLLAGGKGENTIAWAMGSANNADLRPTFTFERIADIVYLGARLYWLYLTRELMEFRWDGNNFYARYGDDGIVTADKQADTMSVKWGDIEVARNYDRFVPSDENTIYAYSRAGGPQTWTLPADWEGKNIKLTTITPEGVFDASDFELDGRTIKFNAEAQRPIKIVKV